MPDARSAARAKMRDQFMSDAEMFFGGSESVETSIVNFLEYALDVYDEALTQANLLRKPGDVEGWRPIEELTYEIYFPPMMLRGPKFVHEDFNPHGIVEGTLISDEPEHPVVVTRWNSSHDCYTDDRYDSIEESGATHFAIITPPEVK